MISSKTALIAMVAVAFQVGAAPPPRATVPDGRDAEHDRSWAVVSGVARDITFQPMTRAEGAPSETFYQVLQDRRGFIWFSTRKGLIRYDGYQHVVYPGLPMVRKFGDSVAVPGLLHEDRNGSLWVGTDVLSRFDPIKGTFTPVVRPRGEAPKAESEAITSIHDRPDGTFWVGVFCRTFKDGVARLGSEPVLYQVDPVRRTSIRHPISPEIVRDRLVSILAIQEDPRGRLWLGTGIGLMHFDPANRSFHHYPHTHPDPQIEVLNHGFNSLTWDQFGYLWVHMPAGLERFDPRTGRFDRFIEARFKTMTKDPSGRIWLWGEFPGLKVFDPSRPAESALKAVSFTGDFGQSLETSRVDGFGVDRHGNVWASPQVGSPVNRYSPSLTSFGSHIPNPTDPDSLSGGEILGFAEDNEGSIWIASNIAGLNRFDPGSGRFTRFKGVSGRSKSLPQEIRSIYQDRSGTLWIGGEHGTVGLFDQKSGRYTHIAQLKYSVTSMFEDSTGRFWVGDLLRPIQFVDRRTGAITKTGVKGGHLTFEDRHSNLWFGYPPGLNKLDREGNLRLISIREPDASDPGVMMAKSIYEDSGGLLWVASNKGLYALDPRSEKAVKYSTTHGLATEDLRCMLPDTDGNLWMSTAEGISRFSLSENRFYNFDERDGLQGRAFNSWACYAARDGTLYFGGSTGFNAFHPRHILARPPEPPVILTSLLINGKQAPVAGVEYTQLKHRQNSLTFEFAVVNSINPGKIRYRFRLDGYEKRWTEADAAHRQVRYLDLPPREYVFRAEASTDGRSWMPNGVAFRFVIVPPWWGTWWAKAFATLLAAGLLLGVHRLRIAALERREQHLAALVEKRTAELEYARDQAEAANRAKSAFLANISHELRTPLNAILGFSRLLRDSGVSSEQREKVQIINRSGEHLLTLIDDVLDLAKIEAGREELVKTPCDLAAIVNDVTEMMRVRAQAKNLELICTRPEDFPRSVWADAPKLRQILINLLGNAVKFTDAGTVTLRATTAPESGGRLRLRFEVEDTGAGIPREDQARIFEPFVQGGQSGKQKGTGLGLTITRRFVELMDGTIELESELGRGSRFIVEIPVEAAPDSALPDARPLQEEVPRLAPGQPEYRVLIVDDNPENGMVLEQMLAQSGFQVRTAPNGALGVEQFQQWRPHFIWMDVRMPEMGGMEATRRIREMEGGREVKIAAMTASAFMSERGAVMASGMDDFVGKPFRVREVFECMEKLLGVQYSQGAPAEPCLLRPAALAELPRQMRRELADAVVSLDQQRIQSAIDKVKQVDQASASALSRLVEGLSYTAILSAIETAETEAARQNQDVSNPRQA